VARIKLLVSVAGEDGWYPGQEVDVDEETAAKWCDGERAERVDEKPTDKREQPRKPVPPTKRAGRPVGEKAVQTPGGEKR
jgi:hypothetical protein